MCDVCEVARVFNSSDLDTRIRKTKMLAHLHVICSPDFQQTRDCAVGSALAAGTISARLRAPDSEPLRFSMFFGDRLWWSSDKPAFRGSLAYSLHMHDAFDRPGAWRLDTVVACPAVRASKAISSHRFQLMNSEFELFESPLPQHSTLNILAP